MYCTSCVNDKPLKGKRVVHKYTACGLPNVILDGVTEYRCPKCGEAFYSYGNIEQLHKLLADILLTKKGLLTGKEVRFLRTQIGYSGVKFATVLGIDHTTLSRIESGKQKMSVQLDHHIREAVYNREPDRNYDLHDAMLDKPTEITKEGIRLKARELNNVVSWKLGIKVNSQLLSAKHA